MSGTLLVDGGSTYLHFGMWREGLIESPESIPYPQNRTRLWEIFRNYTDGEKPEHTAACSVNDTWRKRLFETLDELASDNLRIATNCNDIGLTVIYDKPQTYGVDRALAAIAAYQHFQDACIVVDVGTAITVDAIANDGSIMGGYIFPGPDICVESLVEHTHLPNVDLTAEVFNMGTSTESCIRSGIILGVSGSVNFLHKKAQMTVSSGNNTIITGGGAQHLSGNFSFNYLYRRYAVLEGLGYKYENLPTYYNTY